MTTGRSASFQQMFRGRNIRALAPVTGMSRTEFLERCDEIVHDTEREMVAVYEEAKGGPLSTDEMEDARHQGFLQAYRSLGRSYLFFFVVKCLQNESWLDNDYAYRLCCDVQTNKWSLPVMLWVIAREHFKSTIITALSTLWELINDPNLTFAIISYNEGQAKAFMSIIKNVCERNDLLRELYPDVIWSNPTKGYEDMEDGSRVTWKWNEKAIEFKRTIQCKEASVAVSGYDGGAITGMHYSRLIMDDVETIDSIKTTNYIQVLKEAVVNMFNAAQAADLKVTMVGTFYARNDMYCALINQAIIDQAIIQPCRDIETGKPMRFTEEQLQIKLSKCTPTDRATQWECDPSMSENAKFDINMIKRWDASNLQGLNIYTFVDPAGTVSNKGDFTSILTVGYDSLENIMIIDLVRDKLLIDQKFRHLASIYRKYRPRNIFYEKVGMQSDIEYMTARMGEYNIRFPITAISPKKGITKEFRIETIIPRMPFIYFPEHCIHRNWQGIDEDMIDSFIMDEMMPFPQGDNDDALDTLAYAVSAMDSNIIEFPTDPMKDQRLSGYAITQDYDPMKYARSMLA